MRTIAIMNQKGGVGKTTSAVNLSAALADMGVQVTLVDLDPQAHASLHLGLDVSPGEDSIHEVLLGEVSLRQARRQIRENLAVVPANIDLIAAEVELAGEVGREVLLRNKLGEIADSTEMLVIDCPPSLGVLTLNALTAVEEVVIPLQPHYLALHGLSKLLDTIRLVRERLNPALRVAGIALCMYEANTRLAGEVADDVVAFLENQRGENLPWSGALLFETRIRRNIRLAEAPGHGQDIFCYDRRCHGAEDYRALAEELRSRP